MADSARDWLAGVQDDDAGELRHSGGEMMQANRDDDASIDCDSLNFNSQSRAVRRPISIEAIFVASFHDKIGNQLDWHLCSSSGKDGGAEDEDDSIDLRDIESRAIIDGAHHGLELDFDFVYFRQHELYAISCYACSRQFYKNPAADKCNEEGGVCGGLTSWKVSAGERRGLRVKSVGLLTRSLHHLNQHRDFLKSQAKFLMTHPNDYSALIAYFNDENQLEFSGSSAASRRSLCERNASLSSSTNSIQRKQRHDAPISSGLSASFSSACSSAAPQFSECAMRNDPNCQKETFATNQSSCSPEMSFCPPGYLYKMWKRFGIDIFVIWKLVLLEKRILFYCGARPPFDEMNNFVLFAYLMGHFTEIGQLCRATRLQFNVNLFEMPPPSNRASSTTASSDRFCASVPYIASTTNQIICEKKELYDALIDLRTNRIVINEPHVKQQTDLTRSDRDRFNSLTSELMGVMQSSGETESHSILINLDKVIKNYFINETSHLLMALLQLSQQTVLIGNNPRHHQNNNSNNKHHHQHHKQRQTTQDLPDTSLRKRKLTATCNSRTDLICDNSSSSEDDEHVNSATITRSTVTAAAANSLDDVIIVNNDDLMSFNLHNPSEDRHFLLAVVQLHRLPLVIKLNFGCCPFGQIAAESLVNHEIQQQQRQQEQCERRERRDTASVMPVSFSNSCLVVSPDNSPAARPLPSRLQPHKQLHLSPQQRVQSSSSMPFSASCDSLRTQRFVLPPEQSPSSFNV